MKRTRPRLSTWMTPFFFGALSVLLSAALVGCSNGTTTAHEDDGGANNNNENENNNTGSCGNNQQEAPEECDGTDLAGQTCESLNLGTGDLACTGDCDLDTSGCSGQAECNNGTIEFPEECDGAELNGATCVSAGFDGGDLVCSSSCTLDTSGCHRCGNNAIEALEQCDGTDLAGQTCADFGFSEGDLGCTNECTLDISGCSGCATPDNMDPVVSSFVPAPETQGAPVDTVISANAFDACGLGSPTMRLTITPPGGPSEVLGPTLTVTGTSTEAVISYTHAGGYTPGSLVEVLLSVPDVNGNTTTEAWRFTVVDTAQLFTHGSNILDEAQPDTNLPCAGDTCLVSSTSGSESRHLLRFYTPLPAGALVLDATLYVGICATPTVAATLSCYRLNAESEAEQATWNDRLTSTPWSSPGADAVPGDRQASPAVGIVVDTTVTPYTHVSGDVTGLVTEWALGADYVGVLCINSGTETLTTCGDGSNAPPRSDITYGPALP